MYPRDFAYWLMGFFELALASGYIKKLKYPNEELEKLLFTFDDCFDEDEFRQTITNHCDLVLSTKGEFKEEYLDFVKWVKTALEFNADIYSIYLKLNQLFEHVIDKSFTSKSISIDLSTVHKPNRHKPNIYDSNEDYSSRILQC